MYGVDSRIILGRARLTAKLRLAHDPGTAAAYDFPFNTPFIFGALRSLITCRARLSRLRIESGRASCLPKCMPLVLVVIVVVLFAMLLRDRLPAVLPYDVMSEICRFQTPREFRPRQLPTTEQINVEVTPLQIKKLVWAYLASWLHLF